MTQAMNISPEIAYREQAMQMEFLKNRNLVLAQSLAMVTAERDQAMADLDARTAEVFEVRSQLDALHDERRVESELQEAAHDASE